MLSQRNCIAQKPGVEKKKQECDNSISTRLDFLMYQTMQRVSGYSRRNTITSMSSGTNNATDSGVSTSSSSPNANTQSQNGAERSPVRSPLVRNKNSRLPPNSIENSFRNMRLCTSTDDDSLIHRDDLNTSQLTMKTCIETLDIVKNSTEDVTETARTDDFTESSSNEETYIAEEVKDHWSVDDEADVSEEDYSTVSCISRQSGVSHNHMPSLPLSDLIDRLSNAHTTLGNDGLPRTRPVMRRKSLNDHIESSSVPSAFYRPGNRHLTTDEMEQFLEHINKQKGDDHLAQQRLRRFSISQRNFNVEDCSFSCFSYGSDDSYASSKFCVSDYAEDSMELHKLVVGYGIQNTEDNANGSMNLENVEDSTGNKPPFLDDDISAFSLEPLSQSCCSSVTWYEGNDIDEISVTTDEELEDILYNNSNSCDSIV